MISIIIYILAIITHDTLFIVPKNNNEADLYIAFRDPFSEIMDFVFLITDLMEQDSQQKTIPTYNKRSDEGKNTKPYYFTPVESEDIVNINLLIKNYVTDDKNQQELQQAFQKSKVILKAKFEVDTKKTFYVDAMVIMNSTEFDCYYRTSEKLNFDGNSKIYDLKWLKSYKLDIEKEKLEVPELYKKFLSRRNTFFNLLENTDKDNSLVEVKLTNESEVKEEAEDLLNENVVEHEKVVAEASTEKDKIENKPSNENVGENKETPEVEAKPSNETKETSEVEAKPSNENVAENKETSADENVAENKETSADENVAETKETSEVEAKPADENVAENKETSTDKNVAENKETSADENVAEQDKSSSEKLNQQKKVTFAAEKDAVIGENVVEQDKALSENVIDNETVTVEDNVVSENVNSDLNILKLPENEIKEVESSAENFNEESNKNNEELDDQNINNDEDVVNPNDVIVTIDNVSQNNILNEEDKAENSDLSMLNEKFVDEEVAPLLPSEDCDSDSIKDSNELINITDREDIEKLTCSLPLLNEEGDNPDLLPSPTECDDSENLKNSNKEGVIETPVQNSKVISKFTEEFIAELTKEINKSQSTSDGPESLETNVYSSENVNDDNIPTKLIEDKDTTEVETVPIVVTDELTSKKNDPINHVTLENSKVFRPLNDQKPIFNKDIVNDQKPIFNKDVVNDLPFHPEQPSSSPSKNPFFNSEEVRDPTLVAEESNLPSFNLKNDSNSKERSKKKTKPSFDEEDEKGSNIIIIKKVEKKKSDKKNNKPSNNNPNNDNINWYLILGVLFIALILILLCKKN